MYKVVERLNCITNNEEIGFSSNEQYMRKVLVKDKTVKHDKCSYTCRAIEPPKFSCLSLEI